MNISRSVWTDVHRLNEILSKIIEKWNSLHFSFDSYIKINLRTSALICVPFLSKKGLDILENVNMKDLYIIQGGKYED